MESVMWGILSTVLIGALGLLYKFVLSLGKQMKCLKSGMLWTEHDRLLWLMKKYLNAGEIEADELENIEGLFNSYKGLGGNGTIAKLWERVQELPIK